MLEGSEEVAQQTLQDFKKEVILQETEKASWKKWHLNQTLKTGSWWKHTHTLMESQEKNTHMEL